MKSKMGVKVEVKMNKNGVSLALSCIILIFNTFCIVLAPRNRKRYRKEWITIDGNVELGG